MRQKQGLTAEMYQAVIAIVDDRLESTRVTRRDYDRLEEGQERIEGRMDRVEAALERLAEAQARTEERVGNVEERVGRLEEGQERLGGRMDRVEAALDRLAEAQARTEERAARLEEGQERLQAAMERLAEAQARTEERVDRLAEAQARTEERVGDVEERAARLEEGQEGLRAAMKELAEAQARTDQSIGALGDVIGYGLEDVARLLLPPYLEKHYGISLQGAPAEELQSRFFRVEDEMPLEIDLYGEGERDGQPVVVLGEAKSRIGGSVVHDFIEVLEQVEPLVESEGEIWRAMFGFYIHPSARPIAEEHDILLVASYQR